MNGVTILATAGVAAFIASDRLRTAVPDRRIRLALAIGFVLMPAAQDLTWHLVYLQWTLAFFLLARVLADEPGPRWVWLDRAVGGDREPDRAVLDPVRAAVRVAAPAARAHGLDRRRLRAHPARLHRHRSSRGGR